jgi:hypothetical protein
MNIPELKSALGVISGKIYFAGNVGRLNRDDMKALSEAVDALDAWPEKHTFVGRARFIAEAVRSCGVFAYAYRAPTGWNQIVEDTDALSRSL